MNEVNLSSLVLLFSLRKHLLVFDEERPERQVIWTGFVSTHFPSLSSTLSLLVEEGIPCINDDSCFRIVNVFNCTRKGFVTTTILVRDLSSYCWRNHSLLTWLSLAMAGNFLSQNAKKNVRHFVAFSTFSNEVKPLLDVRCCTMLCLTIDKRHIHLLHQLSVKVTANGFLDTSFQRLWWNLLFEVL